MNGSAQASRGFFTVLTLVVVIAALRLAQDVFIPLALAVLLTFLLVPMVQRLEGWGINRLIAVATTVIVAFALIAGLFYVVFGQLSDLARELPQYRDQLLQNVAKVNGALRGSMGKISSLITELTTDLNKGVPGVVRHRVPQVEVVEPPIGSLKALEQVFSPLAGPIATAVVVIVFVIFMLLRFSDLRDRIIRLLGERNLRLATEAINDAARRVSRYLIMQTLINGWEGLCVAVGLTFIGLPNAVLWGALTMVLRFIPYVGILVAVAMPLVLSFAVFDRWAPPLLIVGLFAGVETVSYLILEPWLYSRRTGVSPVALLVAAVFWAWLWGAAGLFLAIPLTVCLVVMGKYIPQLAFLHVLLGDQPVLSPHERLYQRLLAKNPDDADDLLDAELRRHPLIEVCDGVILRAMQLIERDHDQGSLREAKRHYILEHIERWTEELADSTPPSVAPAGRGAPDVPDADVASAPEEVAGRTPTVLCLPASDHADELAARLAAIVLSERGFVAHAASRTELPSLEQPPAAILISALPGDAAAHARHLCRRVRARFPGVPIIVGLWHTELNLERSGERLASAGAAQATATLRAAVEAIDAVTSAAGVARIPSVAAASQLPPQSDTRPPIFVRRARASLLR
jgi:predicted PurR-regulated permease PerM